MTFRFSQPFEHFAATSAAPLGARVVIVGSGYGAAMAALALAMRQDKDYANSEILVLERGKEFVPGDFPKTLSDLPGEISVKLNDRERFGAADALFDLRVGENVSSIVGNGLGGTSLINANVAIGPTAEVLKSWPAATNGKPWLANLAPSVDFVRRVLQPTTHPNGNGLAKVKALGKLASALRQPGAPPNHRLADISVTFQDGANAIGVLQKACNDCGNCFTGCNIGAKNTLAMNAWPLAHSLGVKIVTGATVVAVEPGDGNGWRWKVKTHATRGDSETHCADIHAQTVILAAGTFGTTEVLLQSRQLQLSPRLGEGFSLNGDALAFGFGQRNPVQSYAKVPSAPSINPQADQKPGPTIVSLIQVDAKDPRGLIEDATVPQAIARVWGEAVSTQATLLPYESGQRSAWHRRHENADPLAVTADLMDHHQVLLAMGLDRGLGRLGLGADGLNLHWPSSKAQAHADESEQWLDRLLRKASHGFDGGLYLPNPFWSPLPSVLNKAFGESGQLGGSHVTNHPLGGCPMGKDIAGGVVNASGQVFDAATGAVHDGLYVLDGSMMPGALGINPYMTIASLAHYLALQIDAPSMFDPRTPLPKVAGAPLRLPHREGHKVDWPIPVLQFEFRERLLGPGNASSAKKIARLLGLPTTLPANFLVIDACIHFPDFHEWLADPSQSLDADFEMYVDPHATRHMHTAGDSLGSPLASARGKVVLFERDLQLRKGEIKKRAWQAIGRFLLLRPGDLGLLPLSAGWRGALQHAQWRYMRYEFEVVVNGTRVKVSGTKYLRYRGLPERTRDIANPWTTLANIELTFAQGRKQEAGGLFHVDLVRMAKDINALQLVTRAESPQVLMAVGSALGLILRILLRAHLASFPVLRYDQLPSYEDANRPRYTLPPRITYRFPNGKIQRDTLSEAFAAENWRLLRATPRKVTKRHPVLLIHGLAHSSMVFYSNTVDRPMAGHFLVQGYDVWLLDHGLSTSLPQPKDYQPSVDDISTQVADAVKHVAARTARQVLVFSHCVGSAALSMAILNGALTENGQSPIHALVMHAVPPWIHAAQSNLLRAYVGVYFKDRFFPDAFDPIPFDHDKTGPLPGPAPLDKFSNVALDLLAGSLPWTSAELHDHNASTFADRGFARAICNRMTALYGYEWVHDNLDRSTHWKIASLVGPGNIVAYRQLYFFLHRKRITNRTGESAYLSTTRLLDHWTFPTMFLHGERNEVFSADSSRVSAFNLQLISQLRQQCTGLTQAEVQLRLIPDYGHMDVLFGASADTSVFVHISKFFNQRSNPTPVPAPPVKHMRSPGIVTGPIISRPWVQDGKLQVRIWIESNEYQASPTADVEFFSQGNGVAVKWVRHTATLKNPCAMADPSLSTLFWLGDVEIDVANAQLELKLVPQNPSIGISTLTQPSVSLDWRATGWLQRLLGGTRSTALSFVLGSCRYPGLWFDRDVADRVFQEILRQVHHSDGVDHLLLVGDQIYADPTRSTFDIDEDRERYQESYRKALNMRYVRQVTADVPTYFAVDDREFRDEFPQRHRGESMPRYEELRKIAAIQAWNFTIHHQLVPHLYPDHNLWQTFSSAGFDFFVMDTRSERDLRQSGLRRIMSEQQERAFRTWIAGRTGQRPFFLVMGSPIAPIPKYEEDFPELASRSDGLRDFPALMDLIELAGTKRQPVLILSGGDHFSALAESDLRIGGNVTRCVHVTASGLNAPLPAQNQRTDVFDWATPTTFQFPGTNIAIEVGRAKLLSTSRSHALRLDLLPEGSGWRLNAWVIDADADPSNQSDSVSV